MMQQQPVGGVGGEGPLEFQIGGGGGGGQQQQQPPVESRQTILHISAL